MKRYPKETAVGIFVLLGLVCVAYMCIQLGNLRIFSSDHYTVEGLFTDATGLKEGAPVQMLGVDIGYVGSIRLDQESQAAVVNMDIKKGVSIYDDAIASIKTSGLIGDKYVKITPGGAGDLLGPGDTLMDTESAVDIESLISKYVFGTVDKPSE